jgi:competence protein ComEA
VGDTGGPTGRAHRARGHPRPHALFDRVPVGLRAATIAPAGRAVAGLLVLVLLAVAAAAAFTWLARPREQPAPARARTVGAPLTMAPTALATPVGVATPQGQVVVHVAGEVRRPGVVRLPAGSRVEDAVRAAGGLTGRARSASVNLARPLVDGEQLVVLGRGDPPALPAPGPGGAAPTGAGGPGEPVNLNTATLEQLDSLPGIGPVLAQRILDWRAAHGQFTAVDELSEVSGIGEATLEELRAAVTV